MDINIDSMCSPILLFCAYEICYFGTDESLTKIYFSHIVVRIPRSSFSLFLLIYTEVYVQVYNMSKLLGP